MDENILQSLASQRTQQCQLIDLTLGKMGKLYEAESTILRDLYKEDRWRWSPEYGLQVGLPQDLKVQWFSRESTHDLQNRVRPLTLTDGDPDPNADRRLDTQDYLWLLSQLLHYELGFALTPIDAAARIAVALRTGNIRQPTKLQRRALNLRRQYRVPNSLQDEELESSSEVDEQMTGYKGESEGEQELEDDSTEDGLAPTQSSLGSSPERSLALEHIITNRKAFALDPIGNSGGHDFNHC
ncbi:hypothetical protein Z517_05875 [Fonsecaea pedrosoi CBS 271.37]|uniref:Uncharacterized protein n=1 Tax=Fonsecaea pedrosoi CBS 271.37 TaxID=1442368 RepID=A0A0D2GEN7_9EURO|nr:uncharacterized protein Z517_05875 [Fonsecaea pedrosoi CBS 271.37]KIW79263.1 hypothetical protein Z517_05875 [Fonsecaea pedrosoi CBS 271.37]